MENENRQGEEERKKRGKRSGEKKERREEKEGRKSVNRQGGKKKKRGEEKKRKKGSKLTKCRDEFKDAEVSLKPTEMSEMMHIEMTTEMILLTNHFFYSKGKQIKII